MKHSGKEKAVVIMKWLIGVLVVMIILMIYGVLAGPSLTGANKVEPGLSNWDWFIREFEPWRLRSLLNITVYIVLSLMVWWLLMDFEFWSLDIDATILTSRISAAMIILALYLSWIDQPSLYISQAVAYTILVFGIIFLELFSAEMAENAELTAVWIFLAFFLPFLAAQGLGWFGRALGVVFGAIYGIVRIYIIAPKTAMP